MKPPAGLRCVRTKLPGRSQAGSLRQTSSLAPPTGALRCDAEAASIPPAGQGATAIWALGVDSKRAMTRARWVSRERETHGKYGRHVLLGHRSRSPSEARACRARAGRRRCFHGTSWFGSWAPVMRAALERLRAGRARQGPADRRRATARSRPSRPGRSRARRSRRARPGRSRVRANDRRPVPPAVRPEDERQSRDRAVPMHEPRRLRCLVGSSPLIRDDGVAQEHSGRPGDRRPQQRLALPRRARPSRRGRQPPPYRREAPDAGGSVGSPRQRLGGDAGADRLPAPQGRERDSASAQVEPGHATSGSRYARRRRSALRRCRASISRRAGTTPRSLAPLGHSRRHGRQASAPR